MKLCWLDSLSSPKSWTDFRHVQEALLNLLLGNNRVTEVTEPHALELVVRLSYHPSQCCVIHISLSFQCQIWWERPNHRYQSTVNSQVMPFGFVLTEVCMVSFLIVMYLKQSLRLQYWVPPQSSGLSITIQAMNTNDIWFIVLTYNCIASVVCSLGLSLTILS